MTGYVVIDEDAELAELEEALGRKRAEQLGVPWPMPPEIVGPGKFPCGLARPTPYADLTPEQQARVPRQRYYARAVRDPEQREAGGVLEVDATIEAMDGARVVLGGGKPKRIEIERVKVPSKDQLPEKWRDKLEGKPKPPPSDDPPPKGGDNKAAQAKPRE